MEYSKSSDLKSKSLTIENSCSSFIRNELEKIPQSEGLMMVDLCKIVVEKFEGVRDRRQGYVRIGNVLKRKGMDEKFERKVDDGGYTHICRK